MKYINLVIKMASISAIDLECMSIVHDSKMSALIEVLLCAIASSWEGSLSGMSSLVQVNNQLLEAINQARFANNVIIPAEMYISIHGMKIDSTRFRISVSFCLSSFLTAKTTTVA